jgi:hypothetical protein
MRVGIRASLLTAAGLPCFNPHSFRKTLQFGERICRTPEEFGPLSRTERGTVLAYAASALPFGCTSAV